MQQVPHVPRNGTPSSMRRRRDLLIQIEASAASGAAALDAGALAPCRRGVHLDPCARGKPAWCGRFAQIFLGHLALTGVPARVWATRSSW